MLFLSIAARLWVSASIVLVGVGLLIGAALAAGSTLWLAPALSVGGVVLVAVILGTPILALRPLGLSARSLELAVRRLAAGDLEAATGTVAPAELTPLAAALEALASGLRVQRAQRQALEDEARREATMLAARTWELERRNTANELLGRMASRLPGCADERELVELVGRFIPGLLNGLPGVLYLFDEACQSMRPIGRWNEPAVGAAEIAPSDCWGLRRGQPHRIEDVAIDVVCDHVRGAAVTSYSCLPLAAQGETLGLLYIEHPLGPDAVSGADLRTLTETIALSLSNLRLRDRLRNQSVRDPLTGLFNRRYLEESLQVEYERARRAEEPISLLMLDVDHFKHFNDQFGHEAGDEVLKNLGDMLKRGVRKGDVACRYGGEEFMLVLPRTSVEGAAIVAEKIRGAAHNLDVAHHGAPLGAITVSVGVGTYPIAADTPRDLIDAADQALYTAKRLGRDRVVLSVVERPVDKALSR
jgi:diguanylate cyclase (GGDEF)-like protein